MAAHDRVGALKARQGVAPAVRELQRVAELEQRRRDVRVVTPFVSFEQRQRSPSRRAGTARVAGFPQTRGFGV
jgi:hypothetical protein